MAPTDRLADQNHLRWNHGELQNASLIAPQVGVAFNYKRTSHFSRQRKELKKSSRREISELPENFPLQLVTQTRKLLQSSTGARRFVLMGVAMSLGCRPVDN